MRFSRVRFTNRALAEYVKKTLRIGSSKIPQYVNKLDLSKEAAYRKIQDVNNWYTKIIGLDEVRLYQDKVARLQVSL